MSEPCSESQVIITTQPRSHPALRKLPRACIALARLDQQPKQPAKEPVEPLSNEGGSQDTAAAGRPEAAHD